MGILTINRNLLSKLDTKSLSSSSSSDVCFFRRIFPQPAHDPTVVGHMKPHTKSVILIDHVHNGITNCSQLSPAANTSWKDHHRRIGSPFPGEYHRVVGSCNEWTLFWPDDTDVDEYEEDNDFGVNDDGSSFYQYQRRLSLWGPTTNHTKTLPPSLFPRQAPVVYMDIECLGFGYDPKSQDYKLVTFLLFLYSNYYDTRGETHVELYSLKTDEWKPITPSFYLPSPTDSHDSIHINGVFYWASYIVIISFDFADEVFDEIPLPNRGLNNDYCLAEFHDSLAVILPYSVRAEDLTDEEKEQQLQRPFSIKIWVWNGETWDVGPRCAVGDFPAGDEIARPVFLFQNEYLFLQGCAEPQLMLFNCKTGKLEKLGIHHDPLKSPNRSLRKPNVFTYTVPIC